VTTTDGRVLAADVVVVGIGARPATELGAGAGLAIGRAGGYLPNDHGRIADGIWAAGDCCEVMHRITGEYAFVPLGTHANKQGRVVGENLTGGDVSFGGVLGTAITRFAAAGTYLEIARTGLSAAAATAAGFDVAGLVTEGRTASGYMPEASPIATKVLADKASRRLLGVQIVGARSRQAYRHRRRRTLVRIQHRRPGRHGPCLRATFRDRLGSSPTRRPAPGRTALASCLTMCRTPSVRMRLWRRHAYADCHARTLDA
jgi:NADPH-dependent 2,4-dienoyl-CoA reductase/sulfur reductase-like enzyme